MIKLVAFDLDGTIADTIQICLSAFRKALKPYTAQELSEEMIIQTFGLNEEGMVRQLVKDNWQEALNDFYRYYKEMHTLCPEPFPGVRELIRELHERQVPVILITGKGEESCRITLEKFAMEEDFDSIHTGSPVKNIKSELLQNLLIKHNLSSSEIVYIGDTISDIHACQQAGVRCLSAGWASSTHPAELEDYNKEFVFLTIDSLKTYLFQQL